MDESPQIFCCGSDEKIKTLINVKLMYFLKFQHLVANFSIWKSDTQKYINPGDTPVVFGDDFEALYLLRNKTVFKFELKSIKIYSLNNFTKFLLNITSQP